MEFPKFVQFEKVIQSPVHLLEVILGWEDVSDYLRKLLKMRGFYLISDTEKLLIHEIKKKFYYVDWKEKKKKNKLVNIFYRI